MVVSVLERRFYKHDKVSENPAFTELCLGMFLKPHNYIFIIKIKFLIQKTLGLYKQLEFEGSQGTKFIAATLIPGWNFYI